jgi:molecular chaperone HtpG
MSATSEECQFQAETKQLLDLVIHSLYTSKEVFLRELISNASDAMDRLRFEALTNPELLSGDDKYEIRLEADSEARTLSIYDSGVGMGREEVVANIGTIARSGTRELRERMKEEQSNQVLAEFIGQFGVGFYASFMVAEKVTLVTRRAGEAAATKWESSGDGTYKLSAARRETHGTTVTLHLKPVEPENGIEDYTDQWVLSRIVTKHSDFVGYPIVCQFEREITERDEGVMAIPAGKSAYVAEDRTLNSMRPIWNRPQAEITDSEYAEFYRHISHDWNAPLKTIALKAEGSVEYQALLFLPSRAPQDLFYHGTEFGLRLYAKRVMVAERCEELLPSYLRFIKGVVDSADLPLNVSRQMLQQDRHITQIRRWLTKKVLEVLEDLSEEDHDKFLEFWEQFGRVLKEGVSSDYDYKQRILRILLFQSSNDPMKLTSIKGYVERMKDGQDEIYYLTGESRDVVENSPHLEVFKKNGYEVLYLTEPVDELLVQSLLDYEGKRLQSAAKGTVKIGSAEEQEQGEQDLKQREEESSELLQFLHKILDEHVKQVRLSSRLISSPACLVGTETDYSPQLERLLQKGKGGGPKQRRILELNPSHEIFLKMQERFNRNRQDDLLAVHAELLLGYALLAEGSDLPNPGKFNDAVARLMLQTL